MHTPMQSGEQNLLGKGNRCTSGPTDAMRWAMVCSGAVDAQRTGADSIMGSRRARQASAAGLWRRDVVSSRRGGDTADASCKSQVANRKTQDATRKTHDCGSVAPVQIASSRLFGVLRGLDWRAHQGRDAGQNAQRGEGRRAQSSTKGAPRPTDADAKSACRCGALCGI